MGGLRVKLASFEHPLHEAADGKKCRSKKCHSRDAEFSHAPFFVAILPITNFGLSNQSSGCIMGLWDTAGFRLNDWTFSLDERGRLEGYRHTPPLQRHRALLQLRSAQCRGVSFGVCRRISQWILPTESIPRGAVPLRRV